MKLSESIKPISYLKTNASKLIKDVSDNQKTLIITLNGEAKVVLQDVRVFEKTQDTLALLKLLSMSTKELKNGKTRKISDTEKSMSKRIAEFKNSQK
ncbi:MAG: type II toxin-antitoxin system Phd/YefM family antitoxin [Ignavibacteriae bacterium]|nr:type II toxin-antitoxin system Phd/YefM family antitoxin [Ignavibacteriota bacterium]